MRNTERQQWQALLKYHPNFLNIASWIDGPDPPDVLVTDLQNRRIGVELTEWLNEAQTKAATDHAKARDQWLATLDSENVQPPTNYSSVNVEFRSDAKFHAKDAATFRREFYEFLFGIDAKWEKEMEGNPQKFEMDFSAFPTLKPQIELIRFNDYSVRHQLGTKWVVGDLPGGAYDPLAASVALSELIAKKAAKPNYQTLKQEQRLDEHDLVIVYGDLSLTRNTPLVASTWTFRDVLKFARSEFARLGGPFD